MDPDKTLEQIRFLVSNQQELDCDPAPELAGLIGDLDEWLSRGGYPAAAWGRSIYRQRVVWSLVVDADWISIAVFGTEQAALAHLRRQWPVSDDVSDLDLLQAVIDEHKVAVYLQEHEVTG